MADIIKNPHDHEKHPHGHDGHESEVSYERKDVNVFQISAFGIGLLLAVIVSVFAMWAMFDFFYHREDQKNVNGANALMLNERPKLPPEPRLQAEPKKDLKADEETILHSYGWLDPNKGTVRIPIDLAIDMVAQKGLPSKPSPAGGDNDGFRMIPEDSSGGKTLEKISQ
jgi:hypothetical protein